MSTRAQIKFATRQSGQSFDKLPAEINAQFYCHHDGYPGGLGVEIADSLRYRVAINGWKIEDFSDSHGDLEYIYVVWQAPEKVTYISIFEHNPSHECEVCGSDTGGEWTCIFVGEPERLLMEFPRI